MDIDTRKVILVGDKCVGKSSLVRYALTGEYEQAYLPTLGVEVHPLVWNNNGVVRRFNIWDTAGDPRYGGLSEGYYIQAQIAIILHKSGQNTRGDWFDKVRNMCPDIPIVECVNHFDEDVPNLRTNEDLIHLNTASGQGVDDLFDYLITL